ncbi:hypothetical protein BT96DRAFT_989200 [Gymnopus androsaceus JB14]|uniref:Rab-GAP TBC domain-containing protein n=1 Tax=Gymnopus androsaceus JB14 TaxID=1447944 RepID=A0A6A4I5D1_9AGAR|nr:hypothetical protein BT96DRAFT_989200 [Gymnopus androsaceus JB14]
MATDSRPYDAKFWEEARIRSLEPGGFGKDRVEIWMKLLNVEASSDEEIPDMLPEHADERQIRLDTDRSFVLYPDGDVQGHQEELNAAARVNFPQTPILVLLSRLP